MNDKVIIFDFDGTIADTFDAIARITNRLAVEFGYKTVSEEDIAKLRNLTSRQIINQSGISIFKLPFFLKKVKTELNNEIQIVKPVAGIKEVLIDLTNQGNQLVIITSNSHENVNIFLRNNDLINLFSFVCSASTLFGKNKIINNFIKQHNINFSQVIYVGDETRDIDAAKRSNIKVVGVSWGFNSKEVLAKQNPDFLIDQPKELLEVIGSLKKNSEVRIQEPECNQWQIQS